MLLPTTAAINLWRAANGRVSGFQHAGTGKNKKVIENSPC